ncbi:tubby-like protein 8 [Arachis ipaensis]|uniref:tubby-like protein 8 n=1 Tax=Arachis ipaensis TaxID=130454 RepID=UPI0007AFC3AA|nr:tubby-like protein 8 [Arachis ipaensis]
MKKGGCQKSSISGQPYSSLYFNPLNENGDEDEVRQKRTRTRSCSDYGLRSLASGFEDDSNKENNAAIINGSSISLSLPAPKIRKHFPSKSTDTILKPSSLQFWPLPIDIGRCTCLILKEPTPQGHGTLYSLYTYEGQGRQNRKLAVAHHKRRNGKSHFTVAQNVKGLLSNLDDTFLGTMTANLIGSKYHIWDQGYRPNSRNTQPKLPLAVVTYIPTVATCTGSHRSMRAYIPKHQSLSLKNVTQLQHIKGLPLDWEEKWDTVHQLFSKVPLYNKISKQFELDFRDKGKAELRIQRSVKNFQLTLEENGKQTILQLGRVGKSKFVMDYRYPLTGYQAFCMCLASIDTKLCCTV